MNRPSTILYVENDYGNVGGGTLSLYSLIKHLDRSRYEPWITFAVDSPSPMLGEFEALGCRVIRLGRRLIRRSSPPSTPGTLGRAKRMARSAWLQSRRALRDDLPRARQLLRVLRREPIDLVHTNSNLDSDLFAIAAARLARVPVVCHQRAFGRPLPLFRPLVRSVSAAISISHAIERDLLSAASPAESVVVHNGIDIPDSPPVIGPLRRRPRIASIGRLVRWKGHHVFLRALPAVLEKAPDARFSVVGGPVSAEDRAYEVELHELAAGLGLGSKVQFTGHVPDLAGRIADEYDVVVHAAVSPEPFGLVLVEAMAAGRPIVASDHGACPEVIVPGESGLLYEAGNPEALAHSLLQVLTTDGLAEALARAGWERVRSRFDARREAREIEGVYARVLAGWSREPAR